MDIFNQHFQSDWRIDITKLDIKLLDIQQICRICFTTVNISPIAEMEYEEITMTNVIKSFLPYAPDPMDPYNLCSGCTNQLVHFYTFRENWKLSEELLLFKDNPVQFVEDLNIDVQAVVVSIYSDGEEVLDNSVPKAKKRKRRPIVDNSKPKARRRKQKPPQHAQLNKLTRKGANPTSLIEFIDTGIKENSTSGIKIKEQPVKRKYVNKIKCIECKAEYKTRELLREHCNETGHVTKRLNRFCGICGKITTSSALKHHMRTHTKERPYKCDQCSAAFSDSSNLTRHKIVHTGRRKSYICTHCGSTFTQKSSLTIHTRNKHEGGNSNKATTATTRSTSEGVFNPHTCEDCGRIFKRKRSFNIHIQKHKELKLKYSLQTKNSIDSTENSTNSNDSSKLVVSNDNNLEGSDNNDPIDIKTVQTVSNKTSSESVNTSTVIYTNLNENTTSTPDMVFICEICGRSYPTYEQLKPHLLLHGDKKYLCTDCGRNFTTSSALSSHRKVHTREKPYKCTVCPKQFAHSGTLDSHMNTHTGNKPFRCDVCSKKFSQSSHLSYHMLLHSGQKSHVCSYCNRAFTLKSNLTVHMRTHTGEKPYKCDVCERGFYDSSSRKRHHRKAHSEEEIAKAVETKRGIV